MIPMNHLPCKLLLAALLLDQEFHGRTVLRAMMILPWALPTIVNATLWRLIYSPEYGALNSLLTQIGILDTYRSWLGEPSSAMASLIVADAWKNFPLVTLIGLAALQAVPKDIKAAAVVDGAGALATLGVFDVSATTRKVLDRQRDPQQRFALAVASPEYAVT